MVKHNFSLAMTAGVAALVALTACSSGSSSTESNGQKVVGIVTAGANSPYYTAMRCGAERAANKQNVKIRWQGTPSTDAKEEMTVYNGLVSTSPDAMVVIPWDSVAFVQPIKAFRDSGKPVVTADGTLSQPVDIQNTSTDGTKAGAQVAQKLVDGGLKGSVLVVTNAPGNAVQMARTVGFIATLKKAPGVEVLPLQFAGSDATKAATIVAATITAHPDLSLVFGTMDTIGQGAGSAVSAAKKTDAIKVIGYDADPASIEALKSGKYTGLISQNPDFMGYQSVTTLGKILNGSVKAADVKPYHVDSPVLYITKENVDSPEAKPFEYSSTCN